jgi:hypothetical protein
VRRRVVEGRQDGEEQEQMIPITNNSERDATTWDIETVTVMLMLCITGEERVHQKSSSFQDFGLAPVWSDSANKEGSRQLELVWVLQTAGKLGGWRSKGHF